MTVGKKLFMAEFPHPSSIAQQLFRAILEDHASLVRFKKDCFCHDHSGPHAVAVSRKKFLENYSNLFDAMKKTDIPENLYPLFADILNFSEEERHRQAVLVKDLKTYVRDVREVS